MQCLMTWHLETEQHERRINANANANAAEMYDTEMGGGDEVMPRICWEGES